MKDLSYATVNCVNSLYLIIHKINRDIEESHGNKYLTLISTKESKKYKELWTKIRDFISSITNKSDN